MSRHKECVYRAELDMETLVWTRGKGFPLSRLESRLRCLHRISICKSPNPISCIACQVPFDSPVRM
jgi:hypothetical protein